MLSERAIDTILRPLAIYGAMPRALLQKLPPWDTASERTLRRAIAKLKDDGLVKALRPRYMLLRAAKPTPLWYITDDGRRELAGATGDALLQRRATLPPRHLLEHYLGVVEFHIDLALALARQETYRLAGWLNEWDAIGSAAGNGRPTHLYTEFSRRPRLVCAPDFAFLLERRGNGNEPTLTKCYLGEFDRHTTQSAKRIATDKAPGYRALQDRFGFRRFWPGQTVTEDAAKVLVVTTGPERWREALRRAFRDQPHADSYTFACRSDLQPQTMLTAPAFFPTGDGPAKPLLRQVPQEVACA